LGEIIANIGYTKEHIFPYGYDAMPNKLEGHIGKHQEWREHLVEGFNESYFKKAGLDPYETMRVFVMGYRNEQSFLYSYQELQSLSLQNIIAKEVDDNLMRKYLLIYNTVKKTMQVRIKQNGMNYPDLTIKGNPSKIKLVYEFCDQPSFAHSLSCFSNKKEITVSELIRKMITIS